MWMNVTEVASIIDSQFPELSGATVSRLGEGCDSWAFEVGERWVFRFPKRADVAEQLLVESRIVPVLAAASPLPLPAFCFFGRPSNIFPFPFVGYPKLPGLPAIEAHSQPLPEVWAAPTM